MRLDALVTSQIQAEDKQLHGASGLKRSQSYPSLNNGHQFSGASVSLEPQKAQ